MYRILIAILFILFILNLMLIFYPLNRQIPIIEKPLKDILKEHLNKGEI